jgi:hypothetical protein
LTSEELREKFYRLGKTAVTDRKLDEIVSGVERIESADDVAAALSAIFVR